MSNIIYVSPEKNNDEKVAWNTGEDSYVINVGMKFFEAAVIIDK